MGFVAARGGTSASVKRRVPVVQKMIKDAVETSGGSVVAITPDGRGQVVVFDRGRVVQRGPHAELVGQRAADGEPSVYARLHASWVAQQSL